MCCSCRRRRAAGVCVRSIVWRPHVQHRVRSSRACPRRCHARRRRCRAWPRARRHLARRPQLQRHAAGDVQVSGVELNIHTRPVSLQVAPWRARRRGSRQAIVGGAAGAAAPAHAAVGGTGDEGAVQLQHMLSARIMRRAQRAHTSRCQHWPRCQHRRGEVHERVCSRTRARWYASAASAPPAMLHARLPADAAAVHERGHAGRRSVATAAAAAANGGQRRGARGIDSAAQRATRRRRCCRFGNVRRATLCPRPHHRRRIRPAVDAAACRSG
mmetsp:Transcript_5957/g.18354  ORF Transcript_5957/g.18354 Transcript_5957/m.18354 type:complete len:272 (+) Transcript_5957:924-1739(+)